MSEIERLGSELREARLHRELTPQQVEKKIHIRARYIEALEQGHIDLLPSVVQARGFLRNYARFLGFDPDLVMTRWDEALAGGRRRGRRANPPPTVVITPQNGPPPGDKKRTTQTSPVVMVPDAQFNARRGPRLLIVFFVLLLLALLVGLGYIFFQSTRQPQPGEQPDQRSLLLSPLTPTESQTVQPLPPTASPTQPRPSPLPNPAVPFQNTPTTVGLTIEIRIVMRTWLRVTVDDQVQYTGYPGPNTILKYQGQRVNIRAANAGGVELIVNNRDLGVLGARGQIFDQTLTLDTLSSLAISNATAAVEAPFPTLPPVITALPTVPQAITPQPQPTPTNPIIVTPGAAQ